MWPTPFDGDNATTTAVARLTSQPLRLRQVRAGIPRALEEIVLRAMARRPDDRYPSAAALRSALEQIDLRKLEPADDHTVVGAGADATSVSPPSPWSSPGPAPEPAPEPAQVRSPDRRGAGGRRPAPRSAQSKRSWLVPAALIVVVAATLGVVAVLLGRTDMGGELFGAGGEGPGGAAALTVTEVDSFDPFGSGGEHDDELAAILDPDPETVWTSEEYRGRNLGGLKPGVGFVLSLGQSVELGQLQLDSPTSGWAASVYVADAPAADLAGWGPRWTPPRASAGTQPSTWTAGRAERSWCGSPTWATAPWALGSRRRSAAWSCAPPVAEQEVRAVA